MLSNTNTTHKPEKCWTATGKDVVDGWGLSGGGLGYLIIQSLGTLNAADMMVALLVLGVIGIVMALGIKPVESRLLRWRPEYQKR